MRDNLNLACHLHQNAAVQMCICAVNCSTVRQAVSLKVMIELHSDQSNHLSYAKRQRSQVTTLIHQLSHAIRRVYTRGNRGIIEWYWKCSQLWVLQSSSVTHPHLMEVILQLHISKHQQTYSTLRMYLHSSTASKYLYFRVRYLY